MTDQQKMRPCYFCGNDKELIVTNHFPFCVLCRSCGATGPSAHNPEIAVDAWNGRWSDEVAQECLDYLSRIDDAIPVTGVEGDLLIIAIEKRLRKLLGVSDGLLR